MKRLFENKLDNWYCNPNKKPLIVLGVRQCGKTYIIDKFCKEKYKKYIYINLFRDKRLINIYENNETYDERVELLTSTYNFDFDDKECILFVDEVQKCPLFIQDLKAYCEDKRTNIIVAGSLLSVTLRDMEEAFPVGKVNLEYLYPMNFEEFLYATGNERFIDIIKESFINNKPTGLHEELMNLFRRYLYIGGMPEMLQNYIDNNQDVSKINDKILEDIYISYSSDISKHISEEKDKLRAKNIFENIAPQLLKENPKFMYAKLSKDRKGDYVSALDWLVTSKIILKCNQLSSPMFPIAGYIDDNNYKLFISDVGLLRKKLNIGAIDTLMEGDYPYKGVLVENYVAEELQEEFNQLCYWTRKNDSNGNKSEVDFIIQVKDKVIPIEVKSGTNKAQSLNVYNELFQPELMLKIGNYDFGKKGNLKTIPLYAIFCIRELL